MTDNAIIFLTFLFGFVVGAGFVLAVWLVWTGWIGRSPMTENELINELNRAKVELAYAAKMMAGVVARLTEIYPVDQYQCDRCGIVIGDMNMNDAMRETVKANLTGHPDDQHLAEYESQCPDCGARESFQEL